MKKKIVILSLLCIPLFGITQRLYGIINLTAPFSGISYTKEYNKDEFKPRNVRINGSWSLDIVYKAKKVSHKFSFNEMPFEESFKLVNKFMLPQYNPNGGLLGFKQAIHGDAIDHFIFSYALQKEGIKEKRFLFKSSLRFNYSGGLGISLNRSKDYYKEVFSRSSGGASTPSTYYGYDIDINRDGFGLFLKGVAGVDFINRNGKRKLCLSLFFYQGLKNMADFDIHYQYGYFNDPDKQVDVPNQKLYSRGTTFGVSLGVPIKIIK
jgi:hypothetical protein